MAAVIGGRFARCDLPDQADNEAAVTAFGGLYVAFLTGCNCLGTCAAGPVR